MCCVQLRLMFAANSVNELILKQHLDSLAAGYYGKFKVSPHPLQAMAILRCELPPETFIS